MKTLVFIVVLCFPGMCQAQAENVSITELSLDSLSFELPSSVKLRAELAGLQDPEFKASLKELGMSGMVGTDRRANIASWASVFKAWDGTIYLADSLQMALWIRDNGEWRCLVSGLRIDKTFGGAPPVLPVRYLGGGFFAFSETVPGDVPEKSERGFPQALAATFLMDSADGALKERSKSYVYDHAPQVMIPEGWTKLYKLKNANKAEMATPRKPSD